MSFTRKTNSSYNDNALSMFAVQGKSQLTPVALFKVSVVGSLFLQVTEMTRHVFTVDSKYTLASVSCDQA